MTDEGRYQEQLEEERVHEAWVQRQYEQAMYEACYADMACMEPGGSIWLPVPAGPTHFHSNARVAELADAPVSNTGGRKAV